MLGLALAAMPVQAPDTAALPPVVVVARRPDTLATLPLSASLLVVGPAVEPTSRSLADLLAFAPGVFARARGNPSRDDAIAVRGVGARASFGVRGVRVLLDGVPQTLPDGQAQLSAIDPATVARIEVLRGAASALYGNAAGGAILISTAPLTDGWAVDARAGAFGATRVGITRTIAGDQRGIRLTGAREAGTGWRDHATWRTLRAAVRGMVAGEARRLDGTITFTRQALDDPGALTAAEVAADPRAAAPAFAGANAGKEVTHVQGGITGRRAGARWTLEGAAWMQGRSLRNTLPFVDIDLGRAALGTRAAATWRARRGLSLGGGFDVQWLRDDRRHRDPDTRDTVRDQIETALELGPWAQLVWRPVAPAAVHVVGRFDLVRFAVRDRLLAGGDDSDARTLAAPSVSAGVSLRALPGLTPWIGVATRFETPTTTELTNRPTGGGGFNPDLDPERGVQWEAGVRGIGGRGWGRWELVGWRETVRNALVPFESAIEPDRIVYRNAGQLTRRGIEAAFDLTPVRLVRLRGACSVSDLRYDSFSTPDGVFDGNRVPGVPVRRAALGAHIGSERLWLAAEWHASSAVPVDDANTAVAASWSRWDLRVGGTLPLGGVTARGWVALDNVFDTRYVSAVRVNANSGRYYESGAGRAVTIALSISARVPAPDSSD